MIFEFPMSFFVGFCLGILLGNLIWDNNNAEVAMNKIILERLLKIKNIMLAMRDELNTLDVVIKDLKDRLDKKQ